MRTLLRDEFDLCEIFRCLLVLLPLFLMALVSGKSQWQHALIRASARLIGLAPLGVVGRAELSCPSASLAGGVRFRAGAALGLRSFP